jgi:hypothetical protein
MTVYRIFVADIGEYKNSMKYRFIADFSDAKTASDYVGFMRGKKRYAKQDIIVKEVTVTEIDTAAGAVVGVISVLGETLPIEEINFK